MERTFWRAAALGFWVMALCNAVLLAYAWGYFAVLRPDYFADAWPTFSRALSIGDVRSYAWLAAGAGAGRSPFEPLVGQWALFVWLRLLIGLVFPLIVSWAAVKTAMTRSMESATGLLYINVGAIAAGTILAAGLYFGAGLLL